MGKEKDPTQEIQNGRYNPQANGSTDFLFLRTGRHIICAGEINTKIADDGVHIPCHGNKNDNTGKYVQNSTQCKPMKNHVDLARPMIDLFKSKDRNGFSQCSKDCSRQHKTLCHKYFTWHKRVCHAVFLTVHVFLVWGHQDVTEETRPPDANPSNARGNNSVVGHIPHPPLHKSRGNEAQYPAYRSKSKCCKLEMSCVSQVRHDPAIPSILWPHHHSHLSAITER